MRVRICSVHAQALLSLASLGCVLAAPQFAGHHAVHAGPGAYAPAPYAPPAPYHPAPVVHHVEKIPPKPFAYEYGGADAYGRHFAKTETQDEHGTVQGEYRVELPDGRVQIVTYHADHEHGFIADVKYEGVAHEEVYAPAPYAAPVVHHAAPLVHAAPVHAIGHHAGHAFGK
jgi:hypothetical protein